MEHLYTLSLNLHWPAASGRVAIGPGEVHVWATPIVARHAVWHELWKLLRTDERARAEDFFVDEARSRYVTARGVLRLLISQYLALPAETIEFTSDPNGKPRLADTHAAAGLEFNVSHSGDLVLIAVAAGCAVGVDVEQLREVSHLEEIARRFFHPAETEAVLSTPAADRSAAFLRTWTGKEAILKTIGTGLMGSLSEFQVPLSESWRGWIESSSRTPDAGVSRCWLQQLAPCDDYVGAIGSLAEPRHVRCFSHML